MGLFDDIICEYPLPEVGEIPVSDQDFQSKSLECSMWTYTISSNGKLLVYGRELDFHGDILFYGTVNDSYRQYVARFSEGQLLWIKEAFNTQ